MEHNQDILLEISQLKAGYRKGDLILKGISLTLAKGETLGIVGRNGSGKSTLAKAIVGSMPFRQGVIKYKGESITEVPTHQLCHKGISIMHQGGRVFPNLTVYDNLMLAQKHADSSAIETFDGLIPVMSRLSQIKDTTADKLSGGERHQLALAMTLMAGRELVILDEPSAGLMPTAVNDLYTALNKVRESFGTTFLLVEQNVRRAEEFATRLAVMDNGTIIYQGNDSNKIEQLMFM